MDMYDSYTIIMIEVIEVLKLIHFFDFVSPLKIISVAKSGPGTNFV